MCSARLAGIVLATAIVAHRSEAMDERIPCPQCGAPARITERFRLGSTAGPVEHVKTGCVNNHWLTPLAETLAARQPATVPAAQLAPA
jgi:hypothetical protein